MYRRLPIVIVSMTGSDAMEHLIIWADHQVSTQGVLATAPPSCLCRMIGLGGQSVGHRSRWNPQERPNRKQAEITDVGGSE